MLAKCVARVYSPLFEVISEFQLFPQSLAAFDLAGLLPFLLPDGVSSFEDALDQICGNKQTAIIIREDYIVFRYIDRAESRDTQGVFAPRIEPLRAGRPGTVTENR